jgi:glycine betaine/choline ABC-type transport system substrate-binding protein
VPVVRTSVASPALKEVLAKLDAKLTTAAISKLNLEVTNNKEQPAAVAKTWLKSQGLI